MKVPILSGIKTSGGTLRQSYPVNYEPVLVDSGISKGQLRSAPGIVGVTTIGGADRGAIMWNGVQYRVKGTSLVSVVGNVTTILGAIPGSGPVALDYSFDALGIVGGGGLYFWDGASFTQNTDPDLGYPIDMLWIDGYWMLTDGRYLYVTELNNRYAIDPLKYGSAEEDPDAIVGLRKVRGEAYAVGRETVENFQNIGGSGFPFTRNAGGLIPKGAVGTGAMAYFSETFAYVGSGRNEKPSVYLASAGSAPQISTPEIDAVLGALSDAELAAIEIETQTDTAEERLLIHLPNQTLVFMREASKLAQSPVWCIRAGGALGDQAYPLRHLCLQNGCWIGGNAAGQLGYLDEAIETYFGEIVGARFDTVLTYNDAMGGIIHSLELIGLPGNAPFGSDPTIFMSLTFDGETWGQERAISMGKFGQRNKRVQWRPKTKFRAFVGMRFRTANVSIASWSTLNAVVEPLAA